MIRRRRAWSRARAPVAFALALLATAGCESCLKRKPSASFEPRPYPTCPGEATTPEVVAEGTLVSGPDMNQQGVVERFRWERRGCLWALTVHQAWPRQVTDVELLYDGELRPLRAVKRMAAPEAPEVALDRRLYEFQGEHPRMLREGPEGREYFRFEGPEPVALIAPGRAMLIPWVASARLSEGEVTRGPVFDLRELVERQEEGQLRRDPDREDPVLGSVRVYTFYGRESVFTDDAGVVVGDLAGLLDARHVATPLPPAHQTEFEPRAIH